MTSGQAWHKDSYVRLGQIIHLGYSTCNSEYGTNRNPKIFKLGCCSGVAADWILQVTKCRPGFSAGMTLGQAWHKDSYVRLGQIIDFGYSTCNSEYGTHRDLRNLKSELFRSCVTDWILQVNKCRPGFFQLGWLWARPDRRILMWSLSESLILDTCSAIQSTETIVS